jgi:DNA repair and recombination protein RAD52
MTDIQQIEKALHQPLDPANIKGRTKGGASLSYVEAWFVIAEANRIFGALNWNRETIYCKEVSAEKNDKGNHVIGYEAKVCITVNIDGKTVVRHGTGNGSGISKTLFDAYEGAAKEAETDAMKRAFMTFGNPFGLALYDKDQAGVGVSPEKEAEMAIKQQRASDEKFHNAVLKGLSMKTTPQQVDEAFANNETKISALRDTNRDLYDSVMKAITDRKTQLLQQGETA